MEGLLLISDPCSRDVLANSEGFTSGDHLRPSRGWNFLLGIVLFLRAQPHGSTPAAPLGPWRPRCRRAKMWGEAADKEEEVEVAIVIVAIK